MQPCRKKSKGVKLDSQYYAQRQTERPTDRQKDRQIAGQSERIIYKESRQVGKNRDIQPRRKSR